MKCSYSFTDGIMMETGKPRLPQNDRRRNNYIVRDSESHFRSMIARSRSETAFTEVSARDSVSLEDILRTIRRRLGVILLAVVLCAGAGVAFSLAQAPLYQATIRVLIGQQQGIAEDPSQVVNLQSLTLTMSEAVATRTVAEPVIQSLNMKKSPKALLENLSAQAISETQFIEITYTDTDPGRTQRVANAVGDEFSRKVSDISPNVSGITATVWERAGLPGKPVSPDPVRNGLIGAMLGIILGWSLAFLLEFLDDTWQSVTELEQATGLPTLSVVPAFGLAQGKKLVRRSR